MVHGGGEHAERLRGHHRQRAIAEPALLLAFRRRRLAPAAPAGGRQCTGAGPGVVSVKGDQIKHWDVLVGKMENVSL